MHNFNTDQDWKDNEGNTIQAHGGGILYAENRYYWYGENKDIETNIIPTIPAWESDYDPNIKSYIYRTDIIGVSCYVSDDLISWKNEGIVLAAEDKDYTHDLFYKNVLERPKVIYNEKTKKYVMWFHVDTSNYQYARAGVAISDSPTGPFNYIGSIQPNEQMSRDLTLFKDDDERAYLIYSSEANSTMHITLLTADYLTPTKIYTRNFVNQFREAPTLFKHKNRYYIITSGCSGWDPNEAEYAIADDILGKWDRIGNPFVGKNNKTTFFSQSTHVLKIEGQKNRYLFMADTWKKENLRESGYLWLSFSVENERIKIEWQDDWSE